MNIPTQIQYDIQVERLYFVSLSVNVFLLTVILK